MKRADINVSVMQKEVWRMKEDTYKETKHLNAGEFFRYIKGKCKKSGLTSERVELANTQTRKLNRGKR